MSDTFCLGLMVQLVVTRWVIKLNEAVLPSEPASVILEWNGTQTHSKGWPLANDMPYLYPTLSAFLLRAPM